MEKLIIDVRLNEYAPRDPNPNVPFSPEEIGRDAAACREAGASIVHYHARDPESGAPSADAALYAESARRIRAGCDALVMPTLGANTVTDLDARIGHIEAMAKEDATRADLAPLDLASLSLAMYRPGMPDVGGDELVYYNSVATLKALAGRARAVGAMPMAAIWHVGSLRLLGAFAETGVFPRTTYAELFTTEGGLIAGHPGTPRGLQALIDFLPENMSCVWAAACYGANALPLLDYAIERGGHAAIGLGDYPYPELGDGWPSNADLVAAVVEIARRHGREIATPAETRAILGAG
ncbi:MAG: 3-keto-5-aminohexanoate cleavage protein [Deltaproteobacteria bacterium]|nr:3-keto-5-aminohexanoate cleavage protein [Deltaproteobacteria bacterium]